MVFHHNEASGTPHPSHGRGPMRVRGANEDHVSEVVFHAPAPQAATATATAQQQAGRGTAAPGGGGGGGGGDGGVHEYGVRHGRFLLPWEAAAERKRVARGRRVSVHWAAQVEEAQERRGRTGAWFAPVTGRTPGRARPPPRTDVCPFGTDD